MDSLFTKPFVRSTLENIFKKNDLNQPNDKILAPKNHPKIIGKKKYLKFIKSFSYFF